MKKNRFYVFALVMYAMLWLLVPLSGASQLNGIEMTVEQINLLNMDTPVNASTQGMVTLFYTPDATAHYVNIIANDKSDTPQWIVRNLYLPDNSFIADPQSISVRFCLGALGYGPGDKVTSLSMELFVGDNVIDAAPTAGSLESVTVTELNEDAEGEVTPVPALVPAIGTIPLFPTFTAGDNVTSVSYRGCAVPNIDLDNATNPATASYAGDKNACGPASAANSLKWLDATYSEITISPTLREVMEELSEKMGRTATSGVTIDQFIKGKLDFIEAHSLPINVKFQSITIADDIPSSSGNTYAKKFNAVGGYPTWEWLKSEVEAGEDVEMMYYWPDGDGWRGHAVVVTGVEESPAGRMTVKFKHDVRQAEADGLKQESADIVIDTHGRMVLARRGAFIGHVVAESPGVPFPVEMSYFNAAVKENSVIFNWRTASESNNYGFQMYRNGEKVGFVKGNGTTTEPQAYEFVDSNVAPGTYDYDLFQLDFNGSCKKIANYQAIVTVSDFMLAQNYPNPFNASTRISYRIPVKGQVQLTVHNVLGKTVATLVKATQDAGEHVIHFDASHLGSGIYYYRLQTAQQTQIRKLTLLK